MASQPSKIGKYEILSQLGRGGMGVVYKAHDPVIDRIVAIKTILVGADDDEDRNLVERLHMEARSAGRLHHPNIVTVFDYGDQDELSYIVMEYVEGVNLGLLIEENRSIPLRSKLRILTQVADGLAYAHENSVVHRDMKPSNVCVTAKGVAKIFDFGLARFDDTKLTKTGYMAGTIAYMSPERLSGETGIKDDIFALGAIAYEFLTYRRAFPGGSVPEVMTKIIQPETPAAVSTVAHVPRILDAIVDKALAKDVADRYASAADFSSALHEAAASDEVRNFADVATLADRANIFFDDRKSRSVYVGPSSAKLDSEPPSTMQMPQNDPPPGTATAVTTSIRGNATNRDLEIPQESIATQIVSSPRKRSWLPLAIVALVLVGVAGSWLALRKPAPEPVVRQRTPRPAPVANSDLAERTELQLATARSLSDELARRSLNTDEMMQLSDAKARIGMAEKKIHDNDYDTGARLLGDSLNALQAVMTTSNSRLEKPPVQTAPLQPAPVRQPPVIRTAKPAPVPQSRPSKTAVKPVQVAPVGAATPPVIEPRPAAQPVPQPAPQPAPQPVAETPVRQPAPEPVERQIASFMSQLAAAYQAKDVAFFHDHSSHFSDQLASAIRNSPSVRVDLQITRTEVLDPQHANVHVKRTDWFPDPNAPPAKQSLVYHVERSGNGWQLASIARE